MTSSVDKGIRLILSPYLIIMFILTALGSWQAFLVHDTWHMGDWLINYQGGFVRRGFLGEIIYQCSEYTAVSPGFYVFLVQTLCNGLYFIFVFLLLNPHSAVT